MCTHICKQQDIISLFNVKNLFTQGLVGCMCPLYSVSLISYKEVNLSALYLPDIFIRIPPQKSQQFAKHSTICVITKTLFNTPNILPHVSALVIICTY